MLLPQPAPEGGNGEREEPFKKLGRGFLKDPGGVRCLAVGKLGHDNFDGRDTQSSIIFSCALKTWKKPFKKTLKLLGRNDLKPIKKSLKNLIILPKFLQLSKEEVAKLGKQANSRGENDF